MSTYFAITGLVDELIDPDLPKADVVGSPLHGLNMWLAGGLAAEPDDDPDDLTARGPITRWMGFAFGKPRMSKVEAQGLLPLQPGDPSPLFPVCDAIKREGGTVEVGSGPLELAKAGPVKRPHWKRPHYHQALVMSGGEVTGIEVNFEINDVDAEVPESFPNRTYEQFADPLNPESERMTHIHTWATWGQSGGRTDLAPKEIGGKFYRTSQDGASDAEPVPASAWVPASLAGLTVLAEMPVVESGAEV